MKLVVPAGHGGPHNSGRLNWAMGQYAIPKPAGDNYAIGFSLEEWAPFVSSVDLNQDQSIMPVPP